MFERLQHSIVKSTFLHALPYMEFLIFEWTIHFLHALSYMIVFECAHPLVRARRRWDVRPYEDRYFLVSIIIDSSALDVLTHAWAFHRPQTARKMSCRVTHKHGYRLSMCWKSLSTFSNGRFLRWQRWHLVYLKKKIIDVRGWYDNCTSNLKKSPKQASNKQRWRQVMCLEWISMRHQNTIDHRVYKGNKESWHALDTC